jgi:drug/metabolite transporter (DMT)-like permease
MAVVVLGLASAISWGSGDFGGGTLSRRAPLFGIVGLTQFIGIFAALALAITLKEPLPTFPDLAWAVAAGVAGLIGITGLYRGLAEGRMGVVAPTTGLLGAVIPVLFGFVVQGVPAPAALVGIIGALVAVVLVTRAPGAGSDHPSGIEWALLAGVAIAAFNISIGQFSGATAFGLLVVIRVVQAVLMAVLVVAWRQPWRLPRDVLPKVIVIGLLDMGGNAAFILATQAGPLAIAVVLSSLYPVVTVVLAIVVLREHLSRSHVAGIVLTAVSIVLVTAGSVTS